MGLNKQEVKSMQKKVTFKSRDGVAKEFIANITEIDATPIEATTSQYLYAVKSVEINNQTVGLDMNDGFTDPISGQYFIAPDLN